MAAERIEIRFPATMSGFRGAFEQLAGALDGRVLPPAARYGVELVFEEIVANIVRHGAPAGAAAPAVAVALDVADDAVVMTFDDDGPPFDPCAADAPRRTRVTPLDDDSADGGLGLTMVRRAATAIAYRRTPDAKNRLVVTIATAGGRR